MNKKNNFENFSDKGLSGLQNMGNTCFINACIQVLSHTYELGTLLNQPNYKKKVKNKYESALLIEFDNLRQILWSENCIVSPGKFIRTVQKVAEIKDIELFTGYKQNDLPEFLLFIVDCFHSSLSREIKMNISGQVETETDGVAVQCFEMIKKMYSSEYSEIWNLFYAVHVSEIISLETEKRLRLTPEPFFMIDLPIPLNNKSPSIIDCFDLYGEGEILDGENAWYDENIGKKISIKKKISFWSLPSILVIDFKRFNSMNQKNQVLITFPLEALDLSNYVIGYKKSSYIYDLYGVCNHYGGVNGGHYTAFVKNANGKWYHFNDTNVCEMNPGDVVSPRAYCLFYRIKKI
jgi:ubiquitin carboxyl-terminal hydrolase 8